VSVLTALARAQAAESGRAQPLTTVRHTHLSDQPLVLVPLVLAGEAAAPLAALVGSDEHAPKLLVVPNPRNRTQRFEFVAELAAEVLSYVNRRARTVEPVSGRDKKTRFADAPQLLVPNAGGIDFLRLLGRSTRFRRAYGPNAVHRTVPLFGQWLTFFRDQHDRAGSALLLALTEVLGAHWATGQSDLEDANLAALLGWIDPVDGLDGPKSAALAEDPVLWPPAGPSTDPTFDNEVLAPALASADPRTALTQALRGQLEPTWKLMWRAVRLLRNMPEGASVPIRWAADRDAFTAYAQSIIDGVALPQPRLDSAVAAAGRLDRLEREQARYDAQRALDDPLVMAEFRLAGEAFAGTVVGAQPTRRDTSGKRPVLRPHITVETQDPVRFDVGATVVSPARTAQTATVVEIDPPLLVLELQGGMGRGLTPPPGSVPELGDTVTYGPASDAYQPPGRFPAREETPWTHGGPPPEYVPSDTDAVEDWS
jgi:hypothetical protein